MTSTADRTDIITVATWEQATEGRRDTNPFDFIEKELLPHSERVGLYDVVRRYSDEVADALPEHIDFVDNRFVAPAHAAHETGHDSIVQTIREAIHEADQRHRRLVEDWAC